MNSIPKRVLVTGAGRCGTSAFMQLMMLLHGESKVFCPVSDNGSWNNTTNYWNDDVNAGMEYVITEKSSPSEIQSSPYIIKDPRLCCELSYILRKKLIDVEHIFVLIRDYRKSAQSRKSKDIFVLENRTVRCKDNKKSMIRNQIEYNQRAIGVLMETISLYDLKHTVINFPTFVDNEEYLYEKLVNTPLSCSREDLSSRFRILDTKKVSIK